MSHTKGARLDGIVCIEDIRQRCYVDEDTGCWHLRTARGLPLPDDGKRKTLWVHGMGHLTVTRAAWHLGREGRPLPNGWRVYRKCASHDCANPAHMAAGTCKAWGRHMAASGKAVTPAKTMAARVVPKPHQKLTSELKRWLLESEQTGSDAAHALGITQGRANCIRAAHRKALAERPAASIFDLAMRAAA